MGGKEIVECKIRKKKKWKKGKRQYLENAELKEKEIKMRHKQNEKKGKQPENKSEERKLKKVTRTGSGNTMISLSKIEKGWYFKKLKK